MLLSVQFGQVCTSLLCFLSHCYYYRSCFVIDTIDAAATVSSFNPILLCLLLVSIIINRITYSIALMVDQRVGQAPKILFFGKPAHTTTIPAQLALKYDCRLVPISLKRKNSLKACLQQHQGQKVFFFMFDVE